MKIRPCMMDDCPYPAKAQKRKCEWHWLLRQPPEIQIAAARAREPQPLEVGDNLATVPISEGGSRRARVPKTEWPEGERWCSDCQGFVPLFYVTGSKCKAHSSLASHGARVEKVYGITAAEYDALMELQGGLCYICRRAPVSKRLAVDHDHKTGLVRGLLCPDNERGCNHAVIGNLEAHSQDGLLTALKRAVDYIEHPPYERLRGVGDEESARQPEVQETLAERWAREAASW